MMTGIVIRMLYRVLTNGQQSRIHNVRCGIRDNMVFEGVDTSRICLVGSSLCRLYVA